MTRREKFEVSYKRYEQEAIDAKAHAMKAKDEGRKSDYEFWKQIFKDARKQEMHFFNEMMNCND